MEGLQPFGGVAMFGEVGGGLQPSRGLADIQKVATFWGDLQPFGRSAPIHGICSHPGGLQPFANIWRACGVLGGGGPCSHPRVLQPF